MSRLQKFDARISFLHRLLALLLHGLWYVEYMHLLAFSSLLDKPSPPSFRTLYINVGRIKMCDVNTEEKLGYEAFGLKLCSFCVLFFLCRHTGLFELILFQELFAEFNCKSLKLGKNLGFA